MDEGASRNVFDDNKVQFNVQQDNFDEDSEDEDDKKRNQRLEEQLEAFDDIGSEIFNDISDYSPRNSYSEQSKKDCSVAERISYSEQLQTDEEKTENPVWANDSDHSGNFPSDDQIHESPTHFNLRMDNVISEESTSSLPAPKIYNFNSFQDNYSQQDYGHQSLNSDNNIALKQSDLLNSEDPYAQLHCLYNTRGLELVRVKEKLFLQENEIKSLTLEANNLKGKIEMLSISNDGYKACLGEQESKIRSLQNELEEKKENCKMILEENMIVKSKLEVAEGTISSLELQISELTSADCYSKCKDKENKFMQKLSNLRNDDIHNLNLKFRETQNLVFTLERKLQENEKTNDEFDLLQKDEQQMFNQIQDISRNKEKDDILMLEIKNLTEKLQIAEKELKYYDTMLAKGFLKSSIPIKDTIDSHIKNVEFKDSLTRNAYLAFPSQDDKPSNENLSDYEFIKQELVSSVFNNQAYRDEIKKLQDVISSRQQHILNCELNHQGPEDGEGTSKSDFIEKIHILLNDNISIREQNLNLMCNYSAIKKASEKLLCSIQEINEEIKTSSLNLNSVSYMSLLEGLKNYTMTLDNFNCKQHQSIENIRLNNFHTFTKSLLNLKLTNILGTLEILRHDLQAKYDTSNSSYFLQKMILLVERFDTVSQDIKGEICQLTEENLHSRNQMLKIQSDYLVQQKEMHNLQKQKEEMKDVYLNFQNQSLQEIKEKLKREYEIVTNSLKNEIKDISEKLTEAQESYVDVCKEKNILEEEAHFNLKKLESKLDRCSKENALLKVHLKDAEMKFNELCQQNARTMDGSSNTDNHCIQETQFLKNKMNLLQIEIIQLKSILVEQKVLIKKDLKNYFSELEYSKSHLLKILKLSATKINDFKSVAVDVSLSPDIETKHQLDIFTKQLERYKTMSENCKIEKSDLEKQLDTKHKQLNYLTSLYITNIIPLTENSKLHETEKEHLMEKMEQLSQKLKSIENSKRCLIASNEEEIKIITDELQNQESTVKEMKNQWDLKMHEQNKVLHDLELDRENLKEEINTMKKQNSIQAEQYENKIVKLREKYKKLNTNFLKYKNSTDERIDYYLSKAQHFKDSKAELVESYKEYITATRGNLTEGLSILINKINKLQKNIILKTTDLDFLLSHLNMLYKNVPRLDISEK